MRAANATRGRLLFDSHPATIRMYVALARAGFQSVCDLPASDGRSGHHQLGLRIPPLLRDSCRSDRRGWRRGGVFARSSW